MTHPTATSPTRPHSPAATPALEDRTRAVRRAGVVAGASLLLMAVLAGLGVFAAVEGLLTRGDAVGTTADLAASLGTFRLGVAALLGVVALDVVVAVALFVFLRPVHPRLAAVAAAVRLVYAGIFLAAVVQLAHLPGLVESGGPATPDRVMERVGSFDDLWSAGLLLFGVHLLLVGYLAHRSGYVPRLLGALLVLAGAGYVVDSVVAALTTGSPFELSTVTFLGELLLALWLVVRGSRVSIAPVRA